jgi:hypothetical protein
VSLCSPNQTAIALGGRPAQLSCKKLEQHSSRNAHTREVVCSVDEEKEGSCRLPAVAAVAAISAATSAPATAAVSASAASAAEPASAASAAALSLRPGFVDDKVSPAEILTIERSDRALRFFIACDFHEREAARLSGETVSNEVDCRGITTRLSEPFLKLFLRGGKRKIPNV